MTGLWTGGTPAEAASASAAASAAASSARAGKTQGFITADQFYLSMKEAAAEAGSALTLDVPQGAKMQRSNAAVFLQQWLNLKDAAETFDDVADDASYAPAVGAVVKAGLMEGYSKTLFMPGQPLTAEDLTILHDRVAGHLKPFVLEEATIADMQLAIDQGKLTSKQLVQMYLDRIAKYDDQGVSLQAVLTLNPDALSIAEALDQERAAKGPRGPLHGIPILVKDNFDTADMPTTAGCLCLKDSIPGKDAEQIAKLKEAGAIILGKTNLHEFAFGITTSKLPWRANEKSVRARPLSRRLQRRHRCGGRGQFRRSRPWDRHRRIDSHPVQLQQPGGHTPYGRFVQSRRHHPAGLDAGRRRPDGPHGGGCRYHAGRHRRV